MMSQTCARTIISKDGGVLLHSFKAEVLGGSVTYANLVSPSSIIGIKDLDGLDRSSDNLGGFEFGQAV